MNSTHVIPGNIRFVHEESIKPDSLYTKKPLDWYEGRCVKMAFQSAESDVEHMWVLITGRDGEKLVGTLDNDPVVVDGLKFGDKVVLSRTQIEAVHLSWDEWTDEINQLLAENDYQNSWLGPPVVGERLEQDYKNGLTPRQALRRWERFVPDDVRVQ